MHDFVQEVNAAVGSAAMRDLDRLYPHYAEARRIIEAVACRPFVLDEWAGGPPHPDPRGEELNCFCAWAFRLRHDWFDDMDGPIDWGLVPQRVQDWYEEANQWTLDEVNNEGWRDYA